MVKRKLPPYSRKRRICIVCEGLEECLYLEKLKELEVWDEQYHVETKNAKGNHNIPAVYQNTYQNGNYELVLVLCDTEGAPYKDYEDIKLGISDIYGRASAADEVIIFTNPCTMQIILKHFGNDKLKSADKRESTQFIKKYVRIGEKYDGTQPQIKKIMRKIDVENFKAMRKKVSRLGRNYRVIGNSNFGVLIENLSSANPRWLGEIKKLLEGKK